MAAVFVHVLTQLPVATLDRDHQLKPKKNCYQSWSALWSNQADREHSDMEDIDIILNYNTPLQTLDDWKDINLIEPSIDEESCINFELRPETLRQGIFEQF